MENLPIELVSHVLFFLPFHDQMRLMTVCRSWHSAALFALQNQKGFIIGSCMGNKHFCSGIMKVGYLDTISEYAIKLSRYLPPGATLHRSRLSILCPNVEILCDSGCDISISSMLLREYRLKLKYLQQDSSMDITYLGVFPQLEYLKSHSICGNLKVHFPKLKYLDNSGRISRNVRFPCELKGLKLHRIEKDFIHKLSNTEVRNSLEVLHIITDKMTADIETFTFPNLTDVSVRGLEEMGNLFSSLKGSKFLTKLHVSARTCVTVDHNDLLNAFSQLDHLTSLNLRFIILSDPVNFWTRMVQIFAHRLQHLTFSTHFITSQSLRLMTGFAALRTLTLPFIYDQPFLYNNVPESIRNRRPFDVVDLLQFFRTPTASKAILQDVSINMLTLGTDLQVIRDLEAELQEMKQNGKLELAEIRELGNRNSIYV